MTWKVISSPAELLELQKDWDQLAAEAADPNPFYESWFALPALQYLCYGRTVEFLTLWDQQLLIGLIPFEKSRGFLRLPLPLLRGWLHIHGFLGTPLIRKGYADLCRQLLHHWIDSQPSSQLGLVLSQINSTSLTETTSNKSLTIAKRRIYQIDLYQRRILKSTDTAENYLKKNLKSGHRKDLRKKEAGLARLGNLRRICLHNQDCLAYIEKFLELEASGWKGAAGTALLCRAEEADFFRAAITAGAAKNKIVFHGLLLDEQLIAGRFSFLSTSRLFGFKTTYSEKYGQYSPGFLLEIDVVRYVLDSTRLLVADSCAEPRSESFRRLYNASQLIETVLISRSDTWARSTVAILPEIKNAVNKVFRSRTEPGEFRS